jgi:hypothetical protein
MIAATVIGWFKGRDAEELFYDLGAFILVAFVTDHSGEFR